MLCLLGFKSGSENQGKKMKTRHASNSRLVLVRSCCALKAIRVCSLILSPSCEVCVQSSHSTGEDTDAWEVVPSARLSSWWRDSEQLPPAWECSRLSLGCCISAFVAGDGIPFRLYCSVVWLWSTELSGAWSEESWKLGALPGTPQSLCSGAGGLRQAWPIAAVSFSVCPSVAAPWAGLDISACTFWHWPTQLSPQTQFWVRLGTQQSRIQLFKNRG